MQAEIIDRGRGPEIAGTRITVYDILDHLREGWHHTQIAAFLRLSSEQVRAAIRYIEEHQEEVQADYQRILDRSAGGNPPELRAKLEGAQIRLQEELRRRQQWMEANGARDPGRQ